MPVGLIKHLHPGCLRIHPDKRFREWPAVHDCSWHNWGRTKFGECACQSGRKVSRLWGWRIGTRVPERRRYRTGKKWEAKYKRSQEKLVKWEGAKRLRGGLFTSLSEKGLEMLFFKMAYGLIREDFGKKNEGWLYSLPIQIKLSLSEWS